MKRVPDLGRGVRTESMRVFLLRFGLVLTLAGTLIGCSNGDNDDDLITAGGGSAQGGSGGAAGAGGSAGEGGSGGSGGAGGAGGSAGAGGAGGSAGAGGAGGGAGSGGTGGSAGGGGTAGSGGAGGAAGSGGAGGTGGTGGVGGTGGAGGAGGTGGGAGGAGGALGNLCETTGFCAGSAKLSITPTAAHIQGVPETRIADQPVTQFFHLGGFGFGPFELAKVLAEVVPGFDPRLCAGGECVSNEQAKRALHCKAFTQTDATSNTCLVPAAEERTWVRAFYLAQGSGANAPKVVFIAFDAIGAGNLIQRGMKQAIMQRIGATIGLDPDHILIGQTHSHAGADLQGLWGGVPDDWVVNTLYQAAADAVAAAFTNARTAELTYATGEEHAYNNYRRPRYAEDTADADSVLSVLQARVSGGPVIGTIVQYAAHPTSIGTDSGGAAGRAAHPDYPLGLEETVETATGATALYFNGPIADASPSGGPGGPDPYASVYNRGTCLARSALAVLSGSNLAVCPDSDLRTTAGFASRRATLLSAQAGLRTDAREALLPVTNPLFALLGATAQLSRYYDFLMLPLGDIPGIGPQLAAEQRNLPVLAPATSTLVNRITIGGSADGLEIVTIPGESTNTFGKYIRQLATSPNMMLFGLTQNSFGYILPEEEFSFIDPSGDAGFLVPFTSYEEFVSLGPLTAPLLRLQAYDPLFGFPPPDPQNIPPTIAECQSDPANENTANASDCIIPNLLARIDYIQRAYANTCRANDGPEELCSLLDPQTPIAGPCRDAGLPEDICDIFGD